MGVLDSLDLDQSMDKAAYKKAIDQLQFRMLRLQRAVHQLGHRVICVFEGWDSSGKGGAIKRLIETMDPRGYVVHAISAPNMEEHAHNYLWRFWQRLPRDGQIVIFDRSWYGRVMVERVEGFAMPQEWQQAYDEINAFETILHNDRTTIVKFFIHISKDEQLKRFKKRENDPNKTWKLTDEDWRNREKWDQYAAAIEDMIGRTSTEIAPWHLIAGNDKRFTRVQVLQTVINAIDHALPFNVNQHGLLVLDEAHAHALVEAGQLSHNAVETVLEEQKRIKKLMKK